MKTSSQIKRKQKCFVFVKNLVPKNYFLTFFSQVAFRRCWWFFAAKFIGLFFSNEQFFHFSSETDQKFRRGMVTQLV